LLLLLLLIPRFWQRGVAVTYYLQNMVEPIPVQSFAPPAPPTNAPITLPMSSPPEAQTS